jgi:hypothetical protein
MKWIIACFACLGVGFMCGASPKPKPIVTYSYTTELDYFQPNRKTQTMLFSGGEVVGAQVIQTESGPAWVVLFRTPKE